MAIKRDLLKDKLLDSKSFNTVYISKVDEENVRKEQMDILVELLCNERHKAAQTEVFNFMKKEPKTVDLLISAIGEATDNKKTLVMACWESGVDCDRYLSFFTDIVINDHILVALEAFTTIEHMTGKVDPAEIESSLAKVGAAYNKETDPTRKQLLADLTELIRNWQ